MARKKAEPKNLEVKNLKAESINLPSGGRITLGNSNTNVTLCAYEGSAGIWVSNPHGSVALCCQPGTSSPYFIVWGPDNKFPAMAITTDVDGKLSIQLVDTSSGCDMKDGSHWMQHTKYLSGEELLALDKNKVAPTLWEEKKTEEPKSESDDPILT
jgi:hypothetical protein